MFAKRILTLMAFYALCAITNPFSAFAEDHGEAGEHHDAHVECDPALEYPDNPPGSGEGCGTFEDCNENGAFDLGEPCIEHHGEEGGGSEGP